jgi:hypothetical protein
MMDTRPMRTRLPNRRACQTLDVEHVGLHYTVTVSYFEGTQKLAELFVSKHKRGGSVDVAVRDAGILVSLCLQHGCDAATIARAMTRNSNGSASRVVGAILDKILGGSASL